MRKALIPVAVPVGLVVGAAVAAPSLIKRAFAIPPRDMPSTTPEQLGLDGEELWLDGPNGKRLHAWFISASEGRAPAVAVIHGWGGTAADLLPVAPGLHELGLHALFIDARTHGLSEPEDFMSMPRFAEDLETGVAWLRARNDVATIGVIGHSVGAAAAIFTASRNANVDAVVAVASFAHPEELMWRAIPYPAPVKWTLLRIIQQMIGFSFDDIAPRNLIANIQVPILLVHGDADEVIPIEDAFSLRDQQPSCTLIVVPGGKHSDLAAYERYFGDVDEFLRSNLTGAQV